MTDTTGGLDAVRAQIDAVDCELAALLGRRLKLVARAQKIKACRLGRVFDKQREEEVLSHCRRLSEQYALPSGLLDDLLRRMLRESYKCLQSVYASSISSERPLVIVGGRGAMGSLFARLFKAAAYRVEVIDRDNLNDIAKLAGSALALMVSVPVECTPQVIAQMAPYLPEDAILCDLTSVKRPAMQAMLAYHSGPVVGLHPLFGPDTPSLVKQVIVSVPGRDAEHCSFLLEQLRIFGAQVVDCTAEEHDLAMSVIQAWRHFATYCHGVLLSNLHLNLEKIVALSSPAYRLELEMVARLFFQEPHLYAQIIMSSPDNLRLFRRYCEVLQREIDALECSDEQAFVERFLEVRDFFGDFAQQLFKESQSLLAKLQDER